MSRLLLTAIAVELLALAAVLAVLGVRTAGGHRRAARARRRRGPVEAALRDWLVGADPDGPAAAVGALTWREQIELMAGWMPAVDGSSRARLASLSAGTDLVARARRWCDRRSAWRRLRGVRLLTLLGAGGDAVLPLLADVDAEVRAQAAQWVGEHADGEDVARLLPLLSDRSMLVRFAASDGLLRAGPRAVEPVLAYLGRPEAPAAAALRVAEGLADGRFVDAALRWSSSADETARAAAVRLLAAVGGPAAGERLVGLCADPTARVRQEAAVGLGASGHWPSAATLAGMLRDSAWDVRRAAGTALRELGAPGRLFLRRSVSDADAFAAEMARQVLDLPDPSPAAR